nr:retrovirus-related Pol polyprotein from transposon TNT 1-94 [Tanacetum cinerariifolium]
ANIQKIIKEQVKEQVKVQVSKILPKIKKTVNEKLEAKVLTRSSNSSKTSYIVAADLYEMELKKILIEKIERNKSIHQSLPKLKFEKDHLYSACVMGKSKKKSHKPKSEDTNQEKLYLLHMDLFGPIRIESVNGNKYILVIVDDYSQFTLVKCLRSKDEALDFTIKFLKMIQV